LRHSLAEGRAGFAAEASGKNSFLCRFRARAKTCRKLSSTEKSDLTVVGFSSIINGPVGDPQRGERKAGVRGPHLWWARITDSTPANAVSFSSACTMKHGERGQYGVSVD
jgi:hypothetical protein